MIKRTVLYYCNNHSVKVMLMVSVMALALLLVACEKPKPEIRIGLSHADIAGGWGTLMYQEIENELSLHHDYNIKLLVKDAHSNVQKQFRDILDLEKEGIDALIIFPFEPDEVVPAIEKIYDKGIPVVVVDRRLNTQKYNVFIGNDNIKIGFEAGQYALNQLKSKGKVLEISGVKISSTAVDRSMGFRNALQNNPGITINASIDGKWHKDTTMQKVENILKTGVVPDLIYAHSDFMALGASNACKKYNVSPIIIGIDGLPDKDAGIDMVLNKQIDATFYNYPGGDKAAQCAIDLVLKKSVNKNIVLPTFPIDSSNAESIKVAYDMQSEQFVKIKKQQLLIDKMFGTIHTKNLLISFSIVFIVLLAFVVLAILYFLKQKQKHITLIDLQNIKIEQQIEEERSLTEQLLNTNQILQAQGEEIIQKNKYLEKYRNQLEQLVYERTLDLEKALEKAQESDKLKTSFLENISHEIRTPLNSIMGFTDLLNNFDLSKRENEKYHSIIIKNSKQLLESINQIVEIAKLTTGQIDIQRTVFSVSLLFDELKNEISANVNEALKNKSQYIDFKILDAPEVYINSDFFRIKQVLTYLIENAIKFTDKGFIHVGSDIYSQSFVRFYVKDSGIGIKKENQQIIFEKFRKIEDDSDRLFRGIGLSLAISKNIVESLGGTISVESEYGKGSEFSFLIPCTIENEHAGANHPYSMINSKDLVGKTILVAEDEDSNFNYIQVLLRKKGFKVLRAKNGIEAVDYCISGRPDIILMDIKMPVMDGIEAFKRIRKIHPEIVVIAITAHAFINEKEIILKEGFNGYLSKPFTSEAFYKLFDL